MAARGRKSAAELAVAPVVEVVPRPVAPEHLTDAEAAVWEDHVSTLEAGYFWRSDLDRLADLCRHTVSARRISGWIENALSEEATELAELARLHRMREAETRAAAALARSLRLTPQSRYDARGAAKKKASDLTPPWEK